MCTVFRAELLSSVDSGQHSVFITVDRWRSAENFTRFEAQFDTQYRTLDTQLQELTLQERKLGAFAARM